MSEDDPLIEKWAGTVNTAETVADRYAALQAQLAQAEQWIRDTGTKAILDITGDPDELGEHPPDIATCKKAIEAHMRLGVERNDEANSLRLKLTQAARDGVTHDLG